VVEAYVRRLLRDGYTLELFVEGGRSRTGKLLQPKFGMLGMIVDAALSLPRREVYFVPISIGYERIIETSAYGQEMVGGEKEKEDAAGLLRSTEVLRHRYGRIDVQFGQALTLAEIKRDLNVPEGNELTPAKRRGLVTRLANRTMDEINRVTAITPGALTALALLSDRRRSISHGQLLERCQRLLGALRAMGARVLPLIATGGVLRPAAIREAIQLFEEAELVETHRAGIAEHGEERRDAAQNDETMYRVPERKRLELDTSKNHIVHFFVERGLVAVSVLCDPGPPVAVDVVRDRVQSLSKLFKHEFRFHADASFDQIFERTITAMAASGELARTNEGRLTLGEGRDGWPALIWLQTYAAIIRNFVEGYRVAARGLALLLKGSLSEKDLVRRTLIVGDRMYLANEIELREAISKPLLTNALQAFREEGYLQLRDGKYALTPSFADAAAVSTIEGRMSGFTDGAR
jgi:glycerol-3-phosphate O-acyltransferase